MLVVHDYLAILAKSKGHDQTNTGENVNLAYNLQLLINNSAKLQVKLQEFDEQDLATVQLKYNESLIFSKGYNSAMAKLTRGNTSCKYTTLD